MLGFVAKRLKRWEGALSGRGLAVAIWAVEGSEWSAVFLPILDSNH